MKRLALILWLGLAHPVIGADLRDPAGAPEGADLSGLRDITGIETLPPPPPRTWWPYGVALGLVLATALGLAGWKWARRTRPAPTLRPERWALQELDRIEALRLPEVGKVERYYTLIADVLRSYAQLQFDLEAPRQTTAEFIASLRTSSLPEPQQCELGTLLQCCDLAKFAQADFSGEKCRETLESARAIVQQFARAANRRIAQTNPKRQRGFGSLPR